MKRNIVKNNGIKITLTDGVGYEIRHIGYSGACFTIDFSGRVSIGLSQRMYFKPDDWNTIIEEINEGRKFMTKYIVMKVNKFNVEKVEHIKVKDYIRPAIYADESGRGIFYLGRAELLQSVPREKSHIVYMVIDNYDFIRSCKQINNITVAIDIDDLAGYPCFDYYVNKPRKLTKLLCQFPETIRGVVVYKSGSPFGSQQFRLC